MNSLEIREFSENIKKYAKEAKIPWEVKRLVLKEILRDAERQTDEELLVEIQKRDEEERNKDGQNI